MKEKSRVSFVMIERLLEHQLKTRPEELPKGFPKGKVFRAEARKLSDDELVEKLRKLGFRWPGKETFIEWCRVAESGEEVSRKLCEGWIQRPEGSRFDQDWAWLAACVLWERWLPEVLNFEVLDDRIEAGFEICNGDPAGACRIWLDAWEQVSGMMDRLGLKTVEELDRRARGSHFVCNWIQDLEMALGNAARQDPIFHEERLRFCRDYLQWWEKESDQNIVENMRRAIAEALFGLGLRAEAEALSPAATIRAPAEAERNSRSAAARNTRASRQSSPLASHAGVRPVR